MATPGSNPPNTSDEIDLGQLFKLIGNGFHSVFKWFLSVYLYFKSNFFWFAGLIVLGGLTGFILGQLLDEKQELEVIVTPNQDETNYLFNTRSYLYGVVDELQAKIKEKDTVFFRELGMDFAKMADFEIEIAPLTSQNPQIDQSEEQLMEALQEFGNSDALSDILVSEFKNQTIRDHRLMFFFKDPAIGKEYVNKVLAYINSNTYYSRLVQIQQENAQSRIQRNDSLITQIDKLVEVYAGKMGRQQSGSEGQLVFENQEMLNVPSLLRLKNDLIIESETKRLEYEMKIDPITVVSFGEPHKVVEPFLKNNIVFFPLLFVGIFLLGSFIGYLNRKAKELGLQ